MTKNEAEDFCAEVRHIIEIASEEDKEMVERVQSGAAATSGQA